MTFFNLKNALKILLNFREKPYKVTAGLKLWDQGMVRYLALDLHVGAADLCFLYCS